jgi:two-component system, response regulator YesN
MGAESPGRYKVLLVEDEQWVRKGLRRRIEELGLSFEVAAEAIDGIEALQLLEELAPDLLVTDIKMPAMDGIELIKNAFFAYPGMAAIIVSGHGDFEYARKAMRYEVKDFLLKPVSDEALAEALASVRMKLDARKEEAMRALPRGLLSNQEEVAQALEVYIRENFRREIRLGEISERLGITTDYLSKAFKKYAGETPLRRIIRLRINEAKQLLASSPQLDVRTVGELVGYDDQFYFSRVFKSHVGVYPSEFRGRRPGGIGDGDSPVIEGPA